MLWQARHGAGPLATGPDARALFNDGAAPLIAYDEVRCAQEPEAQNMPDELGIA